MVRTRRFAAALLVLFFMFSIVPQSTAFAGSSSQVNEIKVYNYFVGKMGLNTAAACGLLANIKEESNFNVTEPGDGNTSFGLCQWHLGRKSSLIKYCEDKNLDYQSVEGQLSYLEYELKNSYKSIYDYIKSVDNTADGAYKAGYHWCYYYEVPSNRAKKSEKRGSLARTTFWKKYKGYNGKQISIDEGASAGSAAVSSALKVTAQPKSVSVTSGSKAKFTVKASGTGLTYQWYTKKSGAKSWTKWTGHTSATASATAKSNMNGMKVKCKVKDSSGQTVTSKTATLTVTVPLAITKQPASARATAGNKVKFSVKASGTGLTYQWYYKKSGVKSWTKWTGHTSATTSATAKSNMNGMKVRCKVKDSSGKTVTSNSVRLTVSSN